MAHTRSGSPGARRLRPGVVALVIGLGVFGYSDAAAQAGIAGRWRIDVYDVTPTPIFGELQFSDSAGTWRGRAVFSNRSGPPVTLAQVSVDAAGRLRFVVPGEGGRRVTGEAAGSQQLRGMVIADGGRRGKWAAERLDPSIEFYPVLPTFQLRQLVGGVSVEHLFLPAPLVDAAAARGITGRPGGDV